MTAEISENLSERLYRSATVMQSISEQRRPHHEPAFIAQSTAKKVSDLLIEARDALARSSEHSAAADVLERVAAANCADPANDDLTVHLAIKLAEAEQKNIDWAKGNLQRVREDVRADVLLAEAIAAERERCARIAEHDDRQMEWPRLEQDGRRMAPTARMQQAIATAIRRALVSGSTEGGNG